MQISSKLHLFMYLILWLLFMETYSLSIRLYSNFAAALWSSGEIAVGLNCLLSVYAKLCGLIF